MRTSTSRYPHTECHTSRDSSAMPTNSARTHSQQTPHACSRTSGCVRRDVNSQGHPPASDGLVRCAHSYRLTGIRTDRHMPAHTYVNVATEMAHMTKLMQTALDWSTHTHKLTRVHTRYVKMPVRKMCASTLCTSTSTTLHVPRGQLCTHREQDTSRLTCMHTHMFIYTHAAAPSIPGSNGCTFMSSSYEKRLVERAEPFTHISAFLPPPIPICPQRHPSQEAGLETHNAL